MEHISKHLQNLPVEKVPAQTSSLAISKMNLPATQVADNRIIALKYQSKQIGAMTQQETSLWGKTLLLKIHVITGWVIPDSSLQTILIDQFQKKLVEDYPDMNTDEIEYAFRRSGTTIRDWGKQMNLSLIDEVLIPYLGERKRLSHAYEERKAPPPEQRIFTDEELLNLHREDIENMYQRMRNGRVPYNVPAYFKDILVKDGLIKAEDELTTFFVERLGNGYQNIYIKE